MTNIFYIFRRYFLLNLHFDASFCILLLIIIRCMFGLVKQKISVNINPFSVNNFCVTC